MFAIDVCYDTYWCCKWFWKYYINYDDYDYNNNINNIWPIQMRIIWLLK